MSQPLSENSMVTKTKGVETKVNETQEGAGDLVPQDGGPVALMANEFEQDSALGKEHIGMDDIALPYIAILQALSPQVQKSKPQYIPGAEEGMLFNTLTGEVFNGDEGIYVIPCAYQKMFVEWKPRTSGGGFVAAHPTAEILQNTKRDERNFDVLPNGNVVIETSYYYCLMVREKRIDPVIISMARTARKRSRQWNSTMLGIQLMGAKGPFNPPIFSHIYKLKTLPESKNNNSWFTWDIHLYSMINDSELYHKARKLSIDVSKGLVKASVPADTEGGIAEDDEPF